MLPSGKYLKISKQYIDSMGLEMFNNMVVT